MTNIYISSDNLDCDDVARFMYEMKIQSRVTSNKSIVYKNEFSLENGCKIKLDENKSKKEIITLWLSIKKNFDLNCACIKTQDYKGCSNKYIKS
jgi:hypothetical protein